MTSVKGAGSMQIDRSTLDRLVTLGRTKGHLTNEDLQAALPVDSMGADDIALVVVHLEDAGIPVELDESLLAGQASKPSRGTHAFEILPLRSLSTALPWRGRT